MCCTFSLISDKLKVCQVLLISAKFRELLGYEDISGINKPLNLTKIDLLEILHEIYEFVSFAVQRPPETTVNLCSFKDPLMMNLKFVRF